MRHGHVILQGHCPGVLISCALRIRALESALTMLSNVVFTSQVVHIRFVCIGTIAVLVSCVPPALEGYHRGVK